MRFGTDTDMVRFASGRVVTREEAYMLREAMGRGYVKMVSLPAEPDHTRDWDREVSGAALWFERLLLWLGGWKP